MSSSSASERSPILAHREPPSETSPAVRIPALRLTTSGASATASAADSSSALQCFWPSSSVQVLSSRREVRLNFQGPLEALLGFLPLPLAQEHGAKVIQDLDESGVEADRLFVRSCRLIEPPCVGMLWLEP